MIDGIPAPGPSIFTKRTLLVGATKEFPLDWLIWCCLNGGGWNHGILGLSILGISSSQVTFTFIFQRGRYTTNQSWNGSHWWIILENRQERCAMLVIPGYSVIPLVHGCPPKKLPSNKYMSPHENQELRSFPSGLGGQKTRNLDF